MKKLIFVLVICFIAVPAFAELAVTLEDNGDGTINVNYSGADANDANIMPRAFALDVRIDGPGYFSDVSGYKNDIAHGANGVSETFESNFQYPGFGVYPARMTWWLKPGKDSCDVNYCDTLTPLADDANDPGAGDGIDSNHIVLEFGSLYYTRPGDDSNAPLAAGRLCKLHYECGGEPTPEGLNVRVIDEDTYRGGLVFVNGNLGVIDVNMLVCHAPPVECNEPNKPTDPTPADGAGGVPVILLPATAQVFPTLSWSPAAGGVNPKYDVYFGTETTPVTVVSSDQPTTSYLATGALQGKTYYWQIVAKNDCNTTGVASEVWQFNTDCFKGTGPTDVAYIAWVAWGKPSCWCYQRQCDGDINGKKAGQYWVQLTDLNALKAAYGKTDVDLALVTDGICADLNHKKAGQYRVQLTDLNLLKSYYGKVEGSVPICDIALVDFWTN